MTDRELLEKAAKAAGMTDMRFSGPSGMVKMLDPTQPETTGSIGPNWNPLTDDGDALRLAVKLRIDVCIAPDHSTAMAWCMGIGDFIEEPMKPDEMAATRRAIVHAAASMVDA